jgi:hypothetical protein
MITLFSTPKPMEGEFVLLQENAIGSWRALGADVEILLLGDEPGAAECARRFGVRHLPEVARTEFGTPRVDDIFRRAEQAAAESILCYINADIILGADFLAAVRAVAGLRKRFLMVGQRWNLDVEEKIDFTDPGWEGRIRGQVQARGRLAELSAIDYFLFRRELWGNIPPFSVGRTMWDNWLIYQARIRGAAVIDATAALWVVHQNHGYGHHPQGWKGVWEGPEAKRNMELAGGLTHYFTIEDATHLLTGQGLRPASDRAHWRRRWQTLPALWAPAACAQRAWRWISRVVFALRVRVARWRGRIPPEEKS